MVDRCGRAAVLPVADQGTSVAQIDATYGHLVPDSEEYLRGLLDTYDSTVAGRGAVGS